MDFGVRLEIDFYQQDEASIYLETNAVGEDQKFAELLTFCSLAVRNLFNFSFDGDSSGCAHSLSSFLIDVPTNLTKLLMTDLPSAAKLVDYRGTPGRRGFSLALDLNEEKFYFRLDPKGFNKLGTGVSYYAPNSVLLLIKYLARRRIGDREYIRSLAWSANECGKAYISGAITLRSQRMTALQIASQAFSLLIPGPTEMASSESSRCREAAEQGNAQAQVELGLLYDESGQHEQAVNWFLKAAKQGDPDGLRLLGDMYREGKGVAQDASRAAELYRRGSELGDSWCQVNLAVSYLSGEGVPKDVTRAIQLLEVAAANGAIEASTRLGHIFKKGNGVPVDLLTAADWYRKASQKDDPVAQNCLGIMYAKGEGVEQDHAEAAKWFQEAALKGYAQAQYNLAQSYCNGEGVLKNWSEAKRWFYESAKNGFADGQIELAIMLEVEGHIDDAKKWYLLAAQQGHEVAKKKLKEIL